MSTANTVTTEISLLAYIGGRKFTLALVMTILNFIALFFGKLDSGAYSFISASIITAYIAGNVYQHINTAQAAAAVAADDLNKPANTN